MPSYFLSYKTVSLNKTGERRAFNKKIKRKTRTQGTKRDSKRKAGRGIVRRRKAPRRGSDWESSVGGSTGNLWRVGQRGLCGGADSTGNLGA